MLSLLSGCLTAEFKEIRISLNADGKSGTGSMIFTDIGSEQGDDSSDISNEDFNSLLTEYYHGKTLETAMPNIQNIRKRLFISGGKLMGELTFDFSDIAKIGFFRYKNEGPYIYYTLSDGYFTSGQFTSSNGTFINEKMPLVFWDSTTKDFFLKMSLSSAGAKRISLANQYINWERSRK
jgi:hypothetical protein